MKKEELRQKLIERGVPSDFYNLQGGLPNESLCLNYDNPYWEVYYSERGQKRDLKKFLNESEACDYFYSIVKKVF